MKEQVVYDLINQKKAELWSSVEDSIDEIPAIVSKLEIARESEDVEELLCILFEKLEVSSGYIKETSIKIAALEDIKKNVEKSLPDSLNTLINGY